MVFRSDFQANLSLAWSLLTLLSLKSIFITSSHVFFGLPLPAEPDTSTALHLLTQNSCPFSQCDQTIGVSCSEHISQYFQDLIFP